MMRLYFFLIFFSLSIISFSQKKDDNKIKKAEDAYNAALLQLRDGLVRDAVPLLGKAIEYNSAYTEAYLSLAGVYGELKQYDKAVATFEKAKQLDSALFSYLQLSYSIDLAGLGRFDDALAAVNAYLSLPKLSDRSIKSAQYRQRSYQFAIEYSKTHPAGNYVFAPRNLGDSINSKQSEYYPSFTIDDSLFVFTRRTGEGREDFVESLKKNDNYSSSKIINGDINAEPFKGAINISQDGEWLLFAGDFGRQGFGNYDIYMSYNTPKGWSEPLNLGSNVNSEFWESSPSLSADSRGGLDLYQFDLKPDVRPAKTLYIKGYVTDAKTGKGLPCAVELASDSSRQAIMHVQTDETGFYFVPLPVGSDYTLTVNRKNYLLYSDVFDPGKKEADNTYQKNIALQPIELNASVTLKNIQFTSNSFELEPVSEIELNKLLQLLTDNPTVKLQINGYTDNVGTPANNITLSANRAKAVANYLTAHGIDAKRLSSKGFGETKPVADNSTEEGRAKNRRTECVVTGV